MILKQIKTGPMENFSYILAETKGPGIVIDPGWPGDNLNPLLEEAQNSEIEIKYILLTHAHKDHCGGAAELAAITGAEILIHEDELPQYASRGFEYDIILKENDLLNLCGLEIRIIHTPGHSPGSICIYTGANLFTGDTLFVGGCGRADLDGSDPIALYESLHNKIKSLPRDTIIYPGHDYGSTAFSTIGRELMENKFLKAASREEFILIRMG